MSHDCTHKRDKMSVVVDCYGCGVQFIGNFKAFNNYTHIATTLDGLYGYVYCDSCLTCSQVVP